MKSYSEAYKNAGVDITAGYTAVELMKKHIAKTTIDGVCDKIGGFGGIFDLGLVMEKYGIKHPLLVSGTDGCGTKVKIAMLMDKHNTIGIDAVAMCVNDIICCGARPIVFLDYIACGKNYPEKIASIVSGVADGCVMSECALVGGETAEHPGLMPENDYDLAGYACGIVDRDSVIDKESVENGDVIIALPSSGVHSNGFSLVRKVFDIENADLKTPREELGGASLGETLLTPTRIYVKPVLALMDKVKIKALSHITGGGFYENIPRSLPSGKSALIKKDDVRVLPIFKLIEKEGGVSERDMYNTYNMGVGMAVIVSASDAEKALEILKANGEDAYVIGSVVESDEGVIFE